MSDLFHDGVSDDYIAQVGRVMAAAKWHTFQVLTKRPERMRRLLSGKLKSLCQHAHIWWGVSVENQKYGLPRIDILRKCPVQVRFLSVEPLLEDLGTVNLNGIQWMIVGGESGAGARPLEPEWVRSLRNQCRTARLAFFFKQWGGVRKSETGRTLDGRTHNALPARSKNEAPAVHDRRALLETFAKPLMQIATV